MSGGQVGRTQVGGTQAGTARRARLPIGPRVVAAALLLAGGWVHLHLFLAGYREVATIGPLFLADAVLSALGAIALVASGHPAPAILAALFQLGAIAGLALASTVGLFGFHETGIGVGTDIAVAYAVEAAAAMILGLAVFLAVRPAR